MGLKLDYFLDHQLVGTTYPDQHPQSTSIKFEESAGAHRFEIMLSGKLPRHTVLDQHGSIVHDVLASFSAFTLCGINTQDIVCQHARYLHDHNGTTEPVDARFYGVMGCNGCVRFDFQAPILVWLLDHM